MSLFQTLSEIQGRGTDCGCDFLREGTVWVWLGKASTFGEVSEKYYDTTAELFDEAMVCDDLLEMERKHNAKR